jgi:hypothetical protein
MTHTSAENSGTTIWSAYTTGRSLHASMPSVEKPCDKSKKGIKGSKDMENIDRHKEWSKDIATTDRLY